MRGCLDQVGLCVCGGDGGREDGLDCQNWCGKTRPEMVVYHSLGMGPGLYEGEEVCC